MSSCKPSHPLANPKKWSATVSDDVVDDFVRRFRTGEDLRGRYALKLVPNTHLASDRQFYWDRKTGVEMLFEQNPVACVGFSCKMRQLRIGQIQGRKGAADMLRPLVWDAMLVEILAWAAAQYAQRYDAVVILPARKCRWYPRNLARIEEGDDLRNRAQRMIRRYDGLAQRLGFELVKPPGNYIRPLPHIAELDGSVPQWLRTAA